MKKFFTLMLLSLTGMMVLSAKDVKISRTSVRGETKTLTLKENNPLSQKELISKFKSIKSESTNVKKSNSNPNAGEIYTLNIHLEYPDSIVPYLLQYGEDIFGTYYDYDGFDDFEFIFEYDPIYPNYLLAWFKSADENRPDDSYVVVKEIESFDYGTEITFDGADATNYYDFRLLDENGKPFELTPVEVDPTTGTETIGVGTIYNVFGSIRLYKDYINYSGLTFFMYDRLNLSTGKRTYLNKPRSLWTNDLPEGFGVICDYIATTPDPTFCYIGETIGTSEPGIITTSVEDYGKGTFKIMPSEYSLDSSDGKRYEVSLIGALNGWINNSLGSADDLPEDMTSNLPYEFTVYASLPTPDFQGANVYQGIGTIRSIQKRDYFTGTIESPLFLSENGGLQYKPINIGLTGANNVEQSIFNRDFGNWQFADWTKWINPNIPQNPKDYLTIMGNTVPTLSFLGYYIPGEMLPEEYFPYLFMLGYFDFGYMGRNGEARMTDYYIASITDEPLGGVYEFKIMDDNILIDGELQGENLTVLGCQMNSEDFVPPTIQYLALMNKEGKIADRFSSPEEGSFEFWAGDFFYEMNNVYTEDRMNVRPLESVLVEYAPHGSDTFIPLNVTENPDKYFMPAYGYCYEGSLAEVTDNEGWYDLKFTLVDQSGNYQIQTLSPAFKIDSTNSVKSISSLRGKVYVEGNSIVAPEGAKIYSVSGLPISGKNLMPGVYVVKKDTESVKCMIR